jgi:hypothetical protein
MVERRLEAPCATIINGAESGNPAWQRMLEEGHLDYYRRCITYVQRHNAEWQSALCES